MNPLDLIGEGQTLLLILVLLYLSECLIWVKRESVAFVSAWGRRWKLSVPPSWLGNASGGILFLNPLPPDKALFNPRDRCFSASSTLRAAPSPAGDLLVPPIGQDLVFTGFEQRLDRLLLQLPQRLGQRLLERDHHRGVITMGAADRLVDNLVDQAELLQSSVSDAERLCGFGRVVGG